MIQNIIGKERWFARDNAEKLAKKNRVKATSVPNLVEVLEQISVDEVAIIPTIFDRPKKVSQYGPFLEFSASGNPYKRREGMLQSHRDRLDTYIGFCWTPKHGADQRSRIIAADSICAGISLFGYACQDPNSVVVDELNGKSTFVNGRYQGRKDEDGAHYFVEVPSRREKQPRYQFMFSNVAKLAGKSGEIGWELNREGNISDILRYRDQLQYNPALSNAIFFDEHHMAGYSLIVRHQNAIALRNNKGHSLENTPALVANPFPLPSKKAMDLYDKLRHQTLVQNGEGKLRVMHEAEISHLLMASAKMYGPSEIFAWQPKRDGSLSAYRPPKYVTG